MSADKFSKHQKSKYARWVLTDPEGERKQFQTEKELKEYIVARNQADAIKAGAVVAPPP